VDNLGLYGLSPNGAAVYKWSGSGSTWTPWGGPAGWLYAGGTGLLATNPANGDVYLNNDFANQWHRIGGPGANFVISSASQIFGLTPSRNAINIWQGDSWVTVGGPASVVVAE